MASHKFFHAIKIKLIFLITIVITAISLFVYFYFPHKFEESQHKALEDKVNTLAGISSYSVGSAIYFEDIDATFEQILPLIQSNEIRYLVIHNKNDSIFYEYNLPFANRHEYANYETNTITPDNSILRIKSFMKFNNEYTGTLYMGYSLNDLHVEVSEIKENITKVSFIIFLLGGISVFYIGY